MKKYIIAHDLGTSGNKATLFSTDGEMIGSKTVSYPVDFFNGNWAEQDSNDWWKAVCTATKELLSGFDNKKVCAVSFSGQMMGCLCVDENGKPLRKSIIWADMRAEKQEAKLKTVFDEKEFYNTVGHKISSSYSLEKLMWIKENEPYIYEKTYKMLNAKDYIVYKMTGKYYTDFSDASGTNALDLNTMEWSEKIITAADVDKNKFPEIKPSTFIAGEINEKVSSECGLAVGTKVVLGGGDGSCASVGAGSVSEGITYNCLGSSSWISTVSKKPYYDPLMRTVTWAHVIPGLLIPSGTMQTAGAAFSWGKDHLYDNMNNPYECIEKDIKSSKAGSNALLFMPYLLGERCPRWNSGARGSFVGLKMEHTKGDMIRSIVEGVAMNLDIILGILKNAVPINEMIVVGGLAKGDSVRQIFSDVYDMDIIKLKHLEEATSIGAAIIAGVGAGELAGFNDISRFNCRGSINRPCGDNTKTYKKMKDIFEETYKGQLKIFDMLLDV